MIAVTFDTLKLAKRLKDAGFTQKQAAGAAEGLAEALAESYSSKNATTEAIEALGRAFDRRLSALEKGQDELRTEVADLRTGQNELRTEVAELRGTVTRIETILIKILEGQAVLHQNDMELKRRLDGRT